jgi:phosphohistidine phosphatase
MIMRHGDAAMVRGAPDKERPLTELGHDQVISVAEQIEASSLTIHTLIASKAVRAQESKIDLLKNLKTQPQVIEDRDDFYLAGFDELGEQLSQISSEVSSVAVVGHNPGWSEVATVLTGAYCSLGTAYCAVLTGDFSSWHDGIGNTGGWILENLIIPDVNL